MIEILKKRASYSAPETDVFQVRIEKNILLSGGAGTIPGYGEGTPIDDDFGD